MILIHTGVTPLPAFDIYILILLDIIFYLEPLCMDVAETDSKSDSLAWIHMVCGEAGEKKTVSLAKNSWRMWKNKEGSVTLQWVYCLVLPK